MVFKKKYYNRYQTEIRGSLSDFVLWKMGYYDDRNPPLPVPASFVYPTPEKWDRDKPLATWINHSTFFIEIEGIRFLTDPIWSNRCSPFSFVGPVRHHTPPIRLEKLPGVDYVLISHNHYDHLDRPTVKKLVSYFPKIIWLVPEGVKKWFSSLGITRVIELYWWQEVLFPCIKATFVPAQHFSGRKGYDLNDTLWGGWVIEIGQKRFYFVGDTGYNNYDFKKVGEKWNGMDLSLIPIGSYSPRRFMSPIHIEPKDAVKIHEEVQSRLSIGMHWKTFSLADEPVDLPPYELYLALQKRGIDPLTFLAIEPGHVINW